MAQKITVKKAYEMVKALNHSWMGEEVKNIAQEFRTDDVIIYELLQDEIDTKKYWLTNKETGMIECTEDKKEDYVMYIKLREIAENIGNKLI